MNPFNELAESSRGNPPTRVIGIDLGTTNSTVAQVKLPLEPGGSAEAACECLHLEQPTQMGPYIGALVPSVVVIDKAGTVWAGEGAKRMRAKPQDHGLSLEKNLFYETKNEMGLQKRYMRAGEDFNHARKIAGHVLRFLADGARMAAGAPAKRTVVTVPASFQINQRADTLEAAKLAGLELSDFDLLDEPVAALTDYLFTHARDEVWDKPQNVVVFDFGGGTCDVFVARLSPAGQGSAFSVETRSVSRYHRLGGGDFDTAIIHEVLIPQLLKDNNLTPRHFEWTERKKIIEPALRGCAEALKEGLCREIAQLHLHGRYEQADKSAIIARQAPTKVVVSGKDYTRATQWAYLSTVGGWEMGEVDTLHAAAANGDLFVKSPAGNGGQPPGHVRIPEASNQQPCPCGRSHPSSGHTPLESDWLIRGCIPGSSAWSLCSREPPCR